MYVIYLFEMILFKWFVVSIVTNLRQDLCQHLKEPGGSHQRSCQAEGWRMMNFDMNL